MLKIINYYFRGRFERYYLKNKWHIFLDLSLILTIICLIIFIVTLQNYHPIYSGESNLSVNIKPPVINEPPLNVNFSIASSTFKVGSPIILRLKIANPGQKEIKNAIVRIQMLDNNFSIDSINSITEMPSLIITDKNKFELPVPANFEKEIALEVRVSRLSAVSRLLNWQAEFSYELNNDLLLNNYDLPLMTILAELSVKQLAYYTSPQGDQLGIGPLPPVVGLPTTYWIFWEAQSPDEWRDLVVTARLPQGVKLKDRRSLLAGDFSYSTSSRRLIWKVQALKPSSDSYRVGFEVEITPDAQQVGQVLSLLENAGFYAYDVFGKTENEGQLTSLTTNLEFDRYNRGQGIIMATPPEE